MGLIRDPADWARESGWVSRLRAERAAARLLGLSEIIRNTLGEEDEAAQMWAAELEELARYLVPKKAKRLSRYGVPPKAKKA